MKKIFFLLVGIQLLACSLLLAQRDTVFWFAVPEVSWQHVDAEPTLIHVTADKLAATVTLSMPKQPLFIAQTVTIQPFETHTFDITSYVRDGGGNHDDDNIIESGLPNKEGVKDNRGFLLRSTNMITAYLERNVTNNPDIFALKGENGLGKEFIIPSQDFFFNHDFSSSPRALNAFDIIATDTLTTVNITPRKDLKGPEGWIAGATHTIILHRGETVSCVAKGEAIAAHLGGSIVTSDKPIAIMWKDDSVESDESTCYDLMGDQLIPTSLAGYEYNVMRGQLGQDADGANSNENSEFAFVMAIEADTDITYTDENGNSSTNLVNVGDINRKLLNADQVPTAAGTTTDYLHIIADKPIHVFHVTGFGCEMGAAILPTIDGCTGSLDVTFKRSTDEAFFLTIMTKQPNIDFFDIYIPDGSATIPSYHLNSSWFSQVGTTDWYYLNKTNNNNRFSTAHTVVPHITPIPLVPDDVAVRVNNTKGVFHLGVINGDEDTGCRYGYFSNYDFDEPKAISDDANAELDGRCLGDVVQLDASGGLDYHWECTSDNSFSDPDIDRPTVSPVDTGAHRYDCTMNTPCDGVQVRTVVVTMSPKTIANFDMDKLKCCSPDPIAFTNNSLNATDYVWDMGNGLLLTDTTPNDTIFENKTMLPFDKTIVLTALSENCNDYVTKTVSIRPEITAKSALVSKSGCNEVVDVSFTIDGSTGPYVRAHWNWGDGIEEDFYDPSTGNTPVYPALHEYSHQYTNFTDDDTTYYAQVTLYDNLNLCVGTGTIHDTEVLGVARANFTISNDAGCSPHIVKFTNTKSGSVPFTWTFDTVAYSTTATTDTTFSFYNKTADPIVYKIDMEVTRGSCTHDTTQYITVYPEFTTTIETSDPLEGCQPHTIEFSQNTLPNVATNFDWLVGTSTFGSTSGPESKTFENITNTDSTFNIQLITTSAYNCKDSSNILPVTAYAFIDAGFAIEPTQGCSPIAVQVEDNTLGYANVVTRTWTDNANPLPDQDVHNLNYTDTFGLVQYHEILLVNSNGHPACDSSHSETVTVFPEVSAQFTKSADTICHNTGIDFTNTSVFTGAGTTIDNTTPNTSFYWEFIDLSNNDFTSSSQQSPNKIFKNTSGILKAFKVKLSLNVNTCTNEFVDTIYVHSEINAQLNTDDIDVCTPNPTGITLNNTTLGGLTFTWQFSDSTATVIRTN
ncbi:MAG: IgGFc-binding protein, partial [Salinivirgaceae bacterium]|nr:IgGFc-binding protein [Salinivirgaceae bacterium]